MKGSHVKEVKGLLKSLGCDQICENLSVRRINIIRRPRRHTTEPIVIELGGKKEHQVPSTSSSLRQGFKDADYVRLKQEQGQQDTSSSRAGTQDQEDGLNNNNQIEGVNT